MKTPSVEPVLPSRLLPRISFRWFLLVTALGAVLAAVARAAGSGAALAEAAMVMVLFFFACFALFAALFLIIWSLSLVWFRRSDSTLKGSPFAEGQLPPQILPPRDG